MTTRFIVEGNRMIPVAELRRSVDTWEFVRFIGTGVTATLGNIGAVLIAGRYVSYAGALLAGIAVGLAVSFTLTKLVAFQSRSWTRAPGEAFRFVIVFGIGALAYWVVSYLVGTYVLPGYVGRSQAQLGGALVGASVMTLTSYFGHRFFTYRTYLPAGPERER